MPLRLFADECVDARVVAGLRRRGIDIVTAADECLLHASDEEQFARATHLGRPLETADHDVSLVIPGKPARPSPELS